MWDHWKEWVLRIYWNLQKYWKKFNTLLLKSWTESLWLCTWTQTGLNSTLQAIAQLLNTSWAKRSCSWAKFQRPKGIADITCLDSINRLIAQYFLILNTSLMLQFYTRSLECRFVGCHSAFYRLCSKSPIRLNSPFTRSSPPSTLLISKAN